MNHGIVYQVLATILQYYEVKTDAMMEIFNTYFQKDIVFYGVFVSSIVLYLVFVYITPSLIIGKICAKLVKSGNIKYNEILHLPRSTDESRQVVIPCPDFVYSCICIQFQHSNEFILFSGLLERKCEYASAGLYDRNGLCFDIYNHSNKDLYLAIISPTNKLSDKQIMDEIFKKKLAPASVNISIRRMTTMHGILLHRLLISNPETEAYEKCRNIQSKYITAVHCNIEEHGVQSSTNISYYAMISLGILAAIIVGAYTGPPYNADWAMKFSSRIGLSYVPISGKSFLIHTVTILIISGIIAALCTLVTIKIIKNPVAARYLNVTAMKIIGDWRFPDSGMTLDSAGASSSKMHVDHAHIFKNLAMFLHGALGLNPSEVMYGICMKDQDSKALAHGETYCIEIPMQTDSVSTAIAKAEKHCVMTPSPLLNDICQWWSITVYGDDLFLIPNAANSYSVNSIQLGNSISCTCSTDGYARILCGPYPPSHYLGKQDIYGNMLPITSEMLWIPLPLTDVNSTKQKPRPRLILRGL